MLRGARNVCFRPKADIAVSSFLKVDLGLASKYRSLKAKNRD